MYSFSDVFKKDTNNKKNSVFDGSKVDKFRHKTCNDNHGILHDYILDLAMIESEADECMSDILYDIDLWNLSELMARYSSVRYFSLMMNRPRYVVHRAGSSKICCSINLVK